MSDHIAPSNNHCFIDEESQTAIIVGDVNEEMHRDFFEVLNTLSSVTIALATPGGDVETALGIYDLIRRHGKVQIIANGLCASAGTLILQAAAHRAATPSSQFLVHFGSESAESEAERKHNKNVERYWLQQFQQRTGASTRKVRKWHAGETFFNAQQALKERLIDEVIDEQQSQTTQANGAQVPQSKQSAQANIPKDQRTQAF